jgi:NAD(P)-dependent dehydrogenase (short-subunit alcohol dehydrogenase family)
VTVDSRLDGKRAVVTGAGRGLGRAIADGLTEPGAQVIATSRDQSTAAALAKRYGPKRAPLMCRTWRVFGTPSTMCGGRHRSTFW